jgi:1-acyl-sn-glycerol-3-phosphate acyltransferase
VGISYATIPRKRKSKKKRLSFWSTTETMLIKILCALAHILCVRILGWRITGNGPNEKKVMILGAPHTSNLDYFLTLALIHHFQLPLRYLIKDNVFKGPLAPFLRSLGGIPVDRRQSTNFVDNMIRTLNEQEEIALGVLPEGTRKYVDYWKSGFYYIAQGASLPIYPVKVDGPGKHLEMGPCMSVSGDIEADVALLAEYFGDTKGVKPANSGPVRVRPRD